MKKTSLCLLSSALLFVSCGEPAKYMTVVGVTKTTDAAASAGSAALPEAPKQVAAPTPLAKAPEPIAAPTPVVAAPTPAPVVAAPAGPTKMLKPDFPAPEFAGTPLPADNTIPNLDKSGKPTVEVTVAQGVDVLSKGKKVTSSDTNPFTGTLDLVTDGEKNGADGYFVELAPAVQWVQIDLEAEKEIHGVWAWHFHKQAVVYKGVVVGVSNDPEFKNPTFLYNNDYDNSVALGVGSDLSYTETNHGRWMPAKNGPVKGRYVRLYSNGRYMDEMNHYVEVEVYGK